MTERTMRGLLRSAAICVPLLALFPSLAWAQQPQQSQAISADLVVKRGADRVTNGTIVYANVADCGGDPEDPDYRGTATTQGTASVGSIYEFSVTYTSNVPVVEAWLGVGENEDCSTVANRTIPSANVTQRVCTPLGVISSNTREPVFKIPARQIFNQEGRAAETFPDGRPSWFQCDDVSGSPRYTVYILALPSATQMNTGEPVMQIARANLRASFSPFTRRPEAPTDVSGVNGENRLEVNFKAPASSVPLTEFRAYFDNGTGGSVTPTPTPTDDAGGAGSLDGGLMDASTASGGDSGASTGGDTPLACGSGRLENHGVPPENQTGIVRTSASDSKTAVLTDLTNIPVGTSVAAAAVSIDPAGNESRLSDAICIDRVITNGFLDECKAAGEGDCGLHSCSLDPTSKGSLLSAALFMLALAALIRRRGHA